MSKTAKIDEGRAGRVAARRREVWKEKGRDSRTRRKGRQDPKRPSEPWYASFKLTTLCLMMATLGFVLVFLIDTTAGAVGRMRLGDVTVGSLVEKVRIRVLDQDVPRSAEADDGNPRKSDVVSPGAADAAAGQEPSPFKAPPRRSDRLPSDPQTEHARQRLDQLLRRL